MSKNPPKLTKEVWDSYLAKQDPPEPDPRFNRPDTEVFVLLSRIARALDEISEDYHDRAVPEAIALVGGDLHSVDYISAARVKRAILTLAPGMSHSPALVTRMQAAWLDGWTAGALFATENLSAPEPILDEDQGEPE